MQSAIKRTIKSKTSGIRSGCNQYGAENLKFDGQRTGLMIAKPSIMESCHMIIWWYFSRSDSFGSCGRAGWRSHCERSI